MTFNTEDLSPANFSLVFDDGARDFQMIQTDGGTTQIGFGMAQGTATCGLTGKKQTFATNLSGILFANSGAEAIVGGLILAAPQSLSS